MGPARAHHREGPMTNRCDTTPAIARSRFNILTVSVVLRDALTAQLPRDEDVPGPSYWTACSIRRALAASKAAPVATKTALITSRMAAHQRGGSTDGSAANRCS